MVEFNLLQQTCLRMNQSIHATQLGAHDSLRTDNLKVQLCVSLGLDS